MDNIQLAKNLFT